MKSFTAVTYLLIIFLINGCNDGSGREIGVDESLRAFVAKISMDSLGGVSPKLSFRRIDDHIVRVDLTFDLPDSVAQDDWKLTLTPAFAPSRHWAPHLTPTSDHIIARHVFRSPALIVTDEKHSLSLVPDLDLINQQPDIPWYLDMDALSNKLVLGISKSSVKEHVLFVREKGMVYRNSKLRVGFYLITSTDASDAGNPWRRTLAFLWSNWGSALFRKGQPISGSLDPYVKHTYHWAFDSWKKSVWQEFSVQGKKVGAPVFIVNITQSPNYPGPVSEREFRSVWNQAWFSSLRSAQGVYRYGKRTGNAMLVEKARMTKELALSFPQNNGLFPSVVGTAMEKVEVDGKQVSRSKGWQTLFFGNSNRNPVYPWGKADVAPLHILDMSWTANQMLLWHEELEKDPRLVAYATRYADRLLQLQTSDGFFPAWIDEKQVPLSFLSKSPETSMSAAFLLRLSRITNEKKYLDAATRAIDAVIEGNVTSGQWEDFETYWSCSRVLDTLLNKKIARNNSYKQNTLSMYWTANALLDFYKSSGNKRYLESGERVLDELLMYQASWQPFFIPIPALGGFGVMNADGEWNDSRQSLFAETIINYGKELTREEYIQRGLAALRSSFLMMYCPENPATREQWEIVYPFFNEKDYGFMMENYGHGGETNEKGLGIGEFTIYDWGNGAAAEAYNRILDHHGEAFVNGTFK